MSLYLFVKISTALIVGSIAASQSYFIFNRRFEGVEDGFVADISKVLLPTGIAGVTVLLVFLGVLFPASTKK